MTMFGGVEYNDDLYVLDVLSYGWIRGRGESSLGRVDSHVRGRVDHSAVGYITPNKIIYCERWG